MTPEVILSLVVKYGPQVVPLVAQLVRWAKEGKQEVTAEDFALLAKYASATSEDYLRAAGLTPPPK